jgi:Cof subfamily protein (haloacid dehalogenase superfamily)
MPYLSDFQAIFFDIDKTLIPPSGEIFPEVPEIISALVKKNIKVGVCSGRGYPTVVNKILSLFPKDSLHVLAGGALLISTAGEIIWQQTISPEIIDELKVLFENNNQESVYNKSDYLYSHGDQLQKLQNHPWKPIVNELSEMTSENVGLVYIVNPNKSIREYLENHPKLSFKDLINNSNQPYFDITAKGVTKAVALKEWSKSTGIPTEKIIGFGDSANDLEFLQICGFSVAMGNANDEVKSVVNKVIEDVNDKSLPKYVQYILEGNPL